MTRSRCGLILGLLVCTGASFAASTAAWEMSTYQDFARGKFIGLSLTRDGRVQLAPKLDTVFSSGQPSVWSVAQASDGTVYLGTGHRGRVFSVDPGGKSAVIWTSPQPEVFAVAAGSDGAVFAASSPDGKVYRIQHGQAAEYFAPGTRYIWALAVGKDGALYVATGDPGKIFRVTAAGAGELYYDTGQSHVTCLAFDNQGRLLAGSEPNGLIYRISAKDKAFVLYDANLPEIRALATAPDGSIYAAALGGSVAARTAAATTAVSSTLTGTTVVAPATSITVTDEAAQSGSEIKPKADAGKQQTPAAAAANPAPPPVIEMGGVEKSALYRINLDNTVETLWSSKDENAYDVLVAPNQILFSTDTQGRIYRLNNDRRITLITQTNEGETTRLLADPNGQLLVATGSMGKLLRLSDALTPLGTYEAPVHDASTIARWGQLTWRGEKNANAQLKLQTRSGNSARPDRTWSDWSEPVSDPAGSRITSPNARFIQWRAQLAGDGKSSPFLSGVTLAYLPQNTPPSVKSISVTTQLSGVSSTTSKSPVQPTSSGTYSITVTDTGESGASTLSGTSTQSISRGITQQILVSWQAEDPDGDRLVYALYFRGEDEHQWKLLRNNFTESSILFDGDIFADGKYLFRVVASDKMSNAASAARESELVSAPVLFDNTPPVVRAGAPRRDGAKVELELEAHDATSPLRRAEYSLDATAWVPLEAADGVIDGKDEKFIVKLENLSAGEHLIVVRVYDSSNNAGLTKVVVP